MPKQPSKKGLAEQMFARTVLYAKMVGAKKAIDDYNADTKPAPAKKNAKPTAKKRATKALSPARPAKNKPELESTVPPAPQKIVAPEIEVTPEAE